MHEIREGFYAPLRDVPQQELGRRMYGAIQSALGHFPRNTGVIVFAFDTGAGPGGMAYVSNAERADCIAALEEWIAYQRSLC